MHAIRIDRKKRLAAEPHSGHNRYHPDIAPVLEVAEGEEVVLERRDSVDGQVGPDMSAADLAHLDTGLVHPLTGPVFLKGAEPGDMLEVEFLDIVPQPTAFSVIIPGMGFLRDIMTRPFVVHWKIRDGWATSAEIPGVRIPGAPFMDISGVAPSAQKLKEWTEREQRALDAGAFVVPPGEAGAVPGGRIAASRACALSRRAKPAEISTSSSSPKAPNFCFPCSRRGRCFRRAMRISRRATARCASPPSRWERPSPSASRYTRVWRREEPSPARCSRTAVTLPIPRLPCPTIFLVLWACRSMRRARSTGKI
jgi:hypothetical protein